MILLLLPLAISAMCPMMGKVPSKHPKVPGFPGPRTAEEGWREAFEDVDFDEVREDIKKVLVDSKDHWPADWGHYGPLMVRLVWHSSGSYRLSDGRGGLDGGRQRFDPERSWADNTNLDKARDLLEPIKAKHGVGLSYADLYALTGDVAQEMMGLPRFGTCLGRFDDMDGSQSTLLGPSFEQDTIHNCAVQGECGDPFGATVVNLIYVEAAGPGGKPDAVESAKQVRDTFQRMGMDDRETVVLTGGGHAFGKMHGACPKGAGTPPSKADLLGEDPWLGNCKNGKGQNTATSGIEGPWTTQPTKWDNEYFKLLVDYKWFNQPKGPGGANVWWVDESEALSRGKAAPRAVASEEGGHDERVAMSTGDISLIFDEKYKALVEEYAKDEDKLTADYAAAWYKLTTRDMGPYARCIGPYVPEPQPFQVVHLEQEKPLDEAAFRMKMKEMFTGSGSFQSALDMSIADDKRINGSVMPYFAKAAIYCARTVRVTDFTGGCGRANRWFENNVSSAEEWFAYEDIQSTLNALGHGVRGSMEIEYVVNDAWVLAGQMAMEETFGIKLKFCAGRNPHIRNVAGEFEIAPTRDQDMHNAPRSNKSVVGARTNADLMGLTLEDYAAFHLATSFTLMARDENEIFTDEEFAGLAKDKRMNKALKMYIDDDMGLYKKTIQRVWTYLMTWDMFDGPTGNLCDTEPPVEKTCAMMERSECNDAMDSEGRQCIGEGKRKDFKCVVMNCGHMTDNKAGRCMPRYRKFGLQCMWDAAAMMCVDDMSLPAECGDAVTRKMCVKEMSGCMWASDFKLCIPE